MKITQLTAKPQLIKIVIDDEEVINQYGEPIEFWIWDRQPMHKFIKMANIKENDLGSLISAVQEIVLDEDGNSVLSDESVLPTSLLTRVISKVVETLGK